MTAPLLDFQKVTFQWPGTPAPLLREWSWQLMPGETWLLPGPSGCGKTTFHRLAAGLLARQQGRLRRPRGLSTAFVFQEPRLFPWLTLQENLRLAAPAASPRQREELLQKTGLAHKAHCKPQELSGGEAQRGNLVRALLANPQLLLLDEPFSALDTHNAEVCATLLEEWHRNAHTHAILLTTHREEYATLCGATPLPWKTP